MLPGFAALRMGRVPYGESAFSFVGKRGVLSCSCFLLARQGPQPSRWRLRRLTDGAYPLRVKPLFLLFAKEKAVLDSEKEKKTSGRNCELRYNHIKSQPRHAIPRVKPFGVSLLFPAASV